MSLNNARKVFDESPLRICVCRMDEEEIEKVVLAYLKKKGLKQTELALQEEQQAKNNADPDAAKQVLSYSEYGFIIHIYLLFLFVTYLCLS